MSDRGKSGRSKKEAEDILTKEGLSFRLIRKPGHNVYEVVMPNGTIVHMTAACSSGCWRGMKNFRADVRRRIRESELPKKS